MCSGGELKGDCDSTMRVKWSCSYECGFSGATMRLFLSARASVAGSRGWEDSGGPEERSGEGLAAARDMEVRFENVT